MFAAVGRVPRDSALERVGWGRHADLVHGNTHTALVLIAVLVHNQIIFGRMLHTYEARPTLVREIVLVCLPRLEIITGHHEFVI